ncbi:dihydroorotate dehydrogenase electron transfer subunit [Chrysiogenes arsenatis]|uniref:dihydroorotate dehydrogenase electron transfer subunit n=1 Tax=Chrysiogenes arsenatis TaxID=309797 RepID=UPI0003F74034|nr:dihydroorotate dehydrogenase electron transfer subunit [Chrysiogenes arsenatis]
MKVTVISNTPIGGANYRLEVAVSGDCVPLPGQFCMLQANVSGFDPLLKRPISIADFSVGRMSFAYKVVGRGTQIMTTFQPGHTIDILGPLGTGFTLHAEPAVLIGGGVGIAPLLLLARRLIEQGTPVTVLLGAAIEADVVLRQEFAALPIDLRVATLDGSAGTQGFVTGLIADQELAGKAVYCCGPDPMLRAIAPMAHQHGAAFCELSLEAHMACGIGVCLGCVVDTFDAENTVSRQRVCKDGPVFSSEVLGYHLQGVGSVQ